MDYRQLRVELMQSIRGDRSKYSLNQHFGFTYDKIGSWEKTSTTIDWNDFAKFAIELGVPLVAILQRFIHYSDTISDGKALLQHITKGRTPDEISDICKMPVTRIRRLLNNFTPKLEEILQLIDHFYTRECLYALIKSIAKTDLPTFAYEAKRCRDFIELMKENKKIIFCTALLHHTGIINGTVDAVQYISDQLCIDTNTVTDYLNRLVKINIVSKKDNHYLIDQNFIVFGETNEEIYTRAINQAKMLAQFLSLPQGEQKMAIFTHYTGMISANALQLATSELNRAMVEVFRIFESDPNPKDRCISFSLGYFDPTYIFREEKTSLADE